MKSSNPTWKSEVEVEIRATGIGHTDAHTMDSFDSGGIFLSILDHDGIGTFRKIGAVAAVNTTKVKPGSNIGIWPRGIGLDVIQSAKSAPTGRVDITIQ